jgi:hypothetical protein
METNATTGLFDFNKIKQQAQTIILQPSVFFKAMPKSGGFVEPMVFIASMAVLVGVINAIPLLTTSIGAAIGMLIVTIIVTPLIAFIGALIGFVVWKMMGSQQDYETAYRCVAYAAAVSPITALVGLIPYLGVLLTAAISFYYTVIITVEVHAIARKRAQIVFGILFALFALIGFSGEIAARRMAGGLAAYEQQIESGEMTPEEAGEMLGRFMRGVEEGARGASGE